MCARMAGGAIVHIWTRLARWPGLLLCLLFAMNLHAEVAEQAPAVLYTTAEGLTLEPHTRYLLDPESRLTIQDVRTQTVGARFVPMEGPLYQPGNRGAIWFAIRLRQMEFDGDWLIAQPSVSIQDLTFYGPFDSAGREVADAVLTGSQRPYASRLLGNEKMLARAKLQLPGDYILFVRSSSLIARSYEFRLWDVANFYRNDQERRLFDGLCYGLILGLLIYNLVLFLVFRERTYGLYVLQGIFAFLTIATFNGHVARFFFPDLPVLADRFNIIMPALWISSAALFAHSFLAMARYTPRLGWFVLFSALLAFGTSVLGAFGAQELGQRLNELTATVPAFVVFAAGLIAWYRGFSPARIYLIGQLALFGSALSVVLANWGWIPQSVLVEASLQLGMSLELIIFALALSNRIRMMQDIQIEMSRKEVTLTKASETDPLTGVANRAGLVSATRTLLVQAGRRTVILLDLDKFKPINDQHGHAAGDAMLVEIGKRLKSVVRGGDVVARVGGDEFVILISEPYERSTLEVIATRLLEVIKQPLLFGNKVLEVGGSLGIAIYPDNGTSLEDLLQAADAAMYQIKKNGRNGFAFFDDLNDEDAEETAKDMTRSTDAGSDPVTYQKRQ